MTMTLVQCVTETPVHGLLVQDYQNIADLGHKVDLCPSHRCDIATVPVLKWGGP